MSMEAASPEESSGAQVAAIDAALASEEQALAEGVGGVFAPEPAPHRKPRRMYYGDAIRIFGTIAVVIGHCADMRLFDTRVLDRDWWICNIWDSATRWAVPLYIMLSGALLLDPARDEAPRNFYRKRLARLGVPLVFWTAFYMWFSVHYLTGWNRTWKTVFLGLAVGKPYDHLHFIFRIAGLYFFTPMFRVWLRHAPRKMQWWAVGMALALSSGDSIMNAITGNETSVFMRFVPFIGYYLLGYLLRDTVVCDRDLKRCWTGFAATYLLLLLGTGWTVHQFHAPNSFLKGPPSLEMLQYDFLSPVRIAMAIFVWLIFVRIFNQPWPKTERNRAIVGWWASTTLGVYLIHPMFREVVYTRRIWIPYVLRERFMDHGLNPTWPNIWLGVPLMTVGVYALSLLAVAAVMKLPYFRRIMG
jgi:surface polysaccharide O-acyltransferase-like enzyme